MPQDPEHIDFLKGQRQTRQFTTDPVSDADIEALLEVMRWTGSSKNSQPWQFVAVRDTATREALAQATQYTGWIAEAPLVLVVLTAGSDLTAHAYDLGRVDERILLAAQALGLGAGIVTFWGEQGQRIARTALNLPGDWSVYSAVAIGHPSDDAQPARMGGRKALGELVHWDRFGNQERT
jgi:nitroreductase